MFSEFDISLPKIKDNRKSSYFMCSTHLLYKKPNLIHDYYWFTCISFIELMPMSIMKAKEVSGVHNSSFIRFTTSSGTILCVVRP